MNPREYGFWVKCILIFNDSSDVTGKITRHPNETMWFSRADVFILTLKNPHVQSAARIDLKCILNSETMVGLASLKPLGDETFQKPSSGARITTLGVLDDIKETIRKKYPLKSSEEEANRIIKKFLGGKL